ncbi:MAG: hypothetical protein IPH07_32350 [Deltaproteobacteria bacterium]|nr:hypothetical protein [Deltaproteobacteria bacterium]
MLIAATTLTDLRGFRVDFDLHAKMELGRPRAAGAKSVQLEQVPLPRLLFALLHQRFTGTLQLEQPDPAGPRTVWFRGGMAVFTDWISAVQALGEVLVAESLIQAEQLSAALRTMAAEGGKLGEVLLRSGLIDQAGLNEGLRRQCQRKLLELFGLRTGEVVVTAGEFEGPDLGKVNTLELVWAGVLLHFDEARVAAAMGEALAGAMVTTSALPRYHDHFRFSAGDDALLERLAVPTTFDDLSRAPGASRKRVAQLVLTLWSCQMLRVGAAAMVVEATPRAPTSPSTRPTMTAPRAGATAKPTTTKVASAPAGASTSAPAGGAPPRPAAAPTAEVVAAEPVERPQTNEEFIAELVALERKLETGSHAFELLGLELDAGKREAKRAFGELSRRFHPDTMAARGLAHLRDRVGNVFAALSEANVLLSDEQKRETLKDAIERGVSPTQTGADATAMARAAFESEVLARDGDKFLKANRFDRALEYFQRALALTADEPDLQAALTWCEYNLSPKTRADAMTAEKTLAGVVSRAPLIARAHYFRGMVLKDLGAVDPAIAALGKAAQLDPRLIDAERQARALRTARTGSPAAPGRKGLFGGKK